MPNIIDPKRYSTLLHALYNTHVGSRNMLESIPVVLTPDQQYQLEIDKFAFELLRPMLPANDYHPQYKPTLEATYTVSDVNLMLLASIGESHGLSEDKLQQMMAALLLPLKENFKPVVENEPSVKPHAVSDYNYQQLFNAIQAATKIEWGTAIGVSVEKFLETLGATQPIKTLTDDEIEKVLDATVGIDNITFRKLIRGDTMAVGYSKVDIVRALINELNKL